MPQLPSSGVSHPYWPNFEAWLGGIENRIDNALSSSNWILDWFLSPVRTFVGAVLHPVLWFADRTVEFVFYGVHWVFDRIGDAIYDLARAADVAYYDAIGVAQSLFDSIGNAAGDVFGWVTARLDDLWNRTTSFVGSALDTLRGAVYGLFLQAVAFATDSLHAFADYTAGIIRGVLDTVRGWVDDARSFAADAARFVGDAAATLVHDALSTAAHWVDDVAAFARQAVDDLRQWAADAIDIVRRDLLDKVLGPFLSFLDNEWHWALNLLRLVEHSAEWLLWVGEHAVPEAIATYRAIRDLGDASIEDLARWGAALGAGQ